MTKKLLLVVFVLLSANIAQSQYNNYYFYQAQQKDIIYSTNIMSVKFVPGLTNSQKATLIDDAQVDLQYNNMNNIPDLVLLKSIILSRSVLYYPPCDSIPPVEDRTVKSKPGEGSIEEKKCNYLHIATSLLPLLYYGVL